MPNLLDLVRLLDTRKPKPAKLPLELRSVRRAKARDASKASKRVLPGTAGEAIAPSNNSALVK